MPSKKKLFEAGRWRISDLLLILSRSAWIFTRFGSYFQPYFQVFQPGTPFIRIAPKVGIGANEGQKWIQHPRSRGLSCFQPLGPTFVDTLAGPGGRHGPATGSGLVSDPWVDSGSPTPGCLSTLRGDIAT